ncbi:3-dehydroquinate synthase [Enhydrobacter aerosaccus]|uniref:3-dehydroquinate synthase n=1 Tax=Enhydrobacter aerosaccus TaxID=225324 RepID=A0A1T4T4P8_9HYPH|nr:3-dehydroquinate synthase [Enhydrobacter aerosaccus]SKA35221.1 3-dehydroquinate synthase [Enhydrobacter aerosaccus]
MTMRTLAPRTVRVDLAGRGYDIAIGPGLIDRVGTLAAPLLAAPRVIVVSDETVEPLYGRRVAASFEKAGVKVGSVVVPAGESSKEFGAFGRLMNTLLDARPDRKTTLVALGGGVVGDLTGFAAAVLLRGVDFIQVPTTLLAQVDSSVGGKTGINTRHGKNLIGAFYQPRLVVADTDVLDTLPRRELLAGYAEVAKYGLIDDPAFWDWCEANGAAVLAGDAAKRSYAIEQSCRAKARIVAADERETTDLRALLNLGHTFGHALEAETGFGPDLLHGEAVGAGMTMAFDLSAKLGLCPAADARRVREHLGAVGLPVRLRSIGGSNRRNWDADKLIEHMRGDKKAEAGRLTFVLARGIGKTFVTRDIDEPAVRELLDAAIAA